MTNRRIAVGAFVSVAVVVSACGGTTNEGTGGPPGTYTPPPVHGTAVAREDFARQIAQQACPAIAACCSRYGFPSDQNTCLTNAETSVEQGIFGTVNPNSVRYDANAGGDCVAQLVNYYQTCSTARPNVPACQHVLVGLVPAGGACTKSSECADPPGKNAYCISGVCQVETAFSSTPGVLGDACNSTCTTTATSTSCSTSIGTGATTGDKSCETTSGLYCDGTTGKCEVLPKLGKPCTSNCATGAYCEGGTCVAQKGSGPCFSSSECNSATFCAYGQSPSQCVPKHPDGSACQGSEECTSARCSNGVCARDTPVTAQTCSGMFD